MTDILIIKLGAFGDILQAEGALRDIRIHHPGARITVLTRPPYRKLLERCPWVDRVWIDGNAPRWRLDRMAALRRRLHEGGFARVYDLQNSRRTAFYYRWLLPSGVEWSGTAQGCSHPHRQAAPKTVPSLERLAGQLRDAGVPVVHTPQPNVSWMADEVAPLLAAAGVTDSFVVLLPGSSARHPQKRWPHYAALARSLQGAEHRVVTVPGPDELELCRTIPGIMLMQDGRPLDFFQLAGVLTKARFAVGNDSGPTHLAAHLGTPGLALFGRSHVPARMTGIERPSFRVLEAEHLAQLPLETVRRAALEALGHTG